MDIRESKDVKFGKFNHTLTILDINTAHNGTYACIASIGANYDMVKWQLIVRGIMCIQLFPTYLLGLTLYF